MIVECPFAYGNPAIVRGEKSRRSPRPVDPLTAPWCPPARHRAAAVHARVRDRPSERLRTRQRDLARALAAIRREPVSALKRPCSTMLPAIPSPVSAGPAAPPRRSQRNSFSARGGSSSRSATPGARTFGRSGPRSGIRADPRRTGRRAHARFSGESLHPRYASRAASAILGLRRARVGS